MSYRAVRKVYLQARNYGFTSHRSNLRCSFSTAMSESDSVDGKDTASGGRQNQRVEGPRERFGFGARGGNMSSLLRFFSQPAEGRQKRGRGLDAEKCVVCLCVQTPRHSCSYDQR